MSDPQFVNTSNNRFTKRRAFEQSLISIFRGLCKAIFEEQRKVKTRTATEVEKFQLHKKKVRDLLPFINSLQREKKTKEFQRMLSTPPKKNYDSILPTTMPLLPQLETPGLKAVSFREQEQEPSELMSPKASNLPHNESLSYLHNTADQTPRNVSRISLKHEGTTSILKNPLRLVTEPEKG